MDTAMRKWRKIMIGRGGRDDDDDDDDNASNFIILQVPKVASSPVEMVYWRDYCSMGPRKILEAAVVNSRT